MINASIICAWQFWATPCWMSSNEGTCCRCSVCFSSFSSVSANSASNASSSCWRVHGITQPDHPPGKSPFFGWWYKLTIPRKMGGLWHCFTQGLFWKRASGTRSISTDPLKWKSVHWTNPLLVIIIWLVGGWPTPLKDMKVNGKDYPNKSTHSNDNNNGMYVQIYYPIYHET